MNVLAVAAGWMGPPCGDRKFFTLFCAKRGLCGVWMAGFRRRKSGEKGFSERIFRV
jgi:hypothetical protein